MLNAHVQTYPELKLKPHFTKPTLLKRDIYSSSLPLPFVSEHYTLCTNFFTKNGKLKFNIDRQIQNSSSVCDKSTAANNKYRKELTNLHKTGVNPHKEISIKTKKTYLIPSEEKI